MIAIFALVGLVAFAAHVTKKSPAPVVKTGGVFQTQILDDGSLPPNLQRLVWAMKSGMQPEQWLVDAAMNEAYEAGNWPLITQLARIFPCTLKQAEPEKPAVPEAQTDRIGTVIGRNSPFDGVPNDAWTKFVDNLATEKDDYRGERHVGRYHHSKARLRELGIDPDTIGTPDQQYDALVADLSDLNQRAKELIEEFQFQSVNVRGQSCPMTLSGLLGLLKSAGPARARSWITNPADRDQYKMTTDMFLATNGMF